MRKSNKKGFTVVELVIVIAIIAILAAVLIPTFAGLIQKANESKDTQLVKNLNTALAADNKEHKTMKDALDAAAAFGYDVGKINTSATGNEILWDSKNDVFCYLKGDKVEYIPETNLKNGAIAENETYKLWKIYTEAPATQTYSIYWNSDANFTAPLTVGFDAGNNTAITELKYERPTGATQDVVIRTNSANTELVVNAEHDTVKHFDSVGTVHVIAVDSDNCYEENGKAAFTQVDSGKYKTTATADVELLFVSSATNVKVAVTPGTVDHAHAISDTDANTINDTNPGVTFDYDGNAAQATIEDVYHHVEDEDKIGLSTDYATNKAKEEIQNVIEDAKSEEMADTVVWLNKAYNGVDKMSFVDFVDAVNSDENKFAGYIATLQANVTLEGETKLIEEFRGTFDGNNKTIKNISVNQQTAEYVGLFKNVNNGATIKNVNLANANLSVNKKVGALIGKISGSATVSNCSIDSTSSIISGSNSAGLIGYIQATENSLVELTDLTNNATVIAKDTSNSRAAGIVATVTGKFTANFRNCTNNGKIIAGTDSQTGDYVGGIVGSIQGGALVDFADCNAQISDLTGSKQGTMCPWITDDSNVSVSDTQINDISKYFYTITVNFGSIEQGETIYFVSDATQTWPDLLDNKQELSKQKLDTILDFLKWAEEKEYKIRSEYSNSGIIYLLKVLDSVSAEWNKVDSVNGPSYVVAEQEYCTEKGITYSAELFEKTWTTGILYEIK